MIRCDIERCVGCKICEVACSTFHHGAVSSALSRIRVVKLEHIGIDMALACVGCVERPCLECPVEGLFVDERGAIRLDDDICIGCLECVTACPIGAVGQHDDRPLFCDLCDGQTSCVAACPTGALGLSDERPSLAGLAAPERPDSSPGWKRAQHARIEGEPIRERWRAGRRVDG